MGDAEDSARHELIDQLGTQIDRATFGSVKAAYHNHEDVQSIIRVNAAIRLEDVGIMCMSDDLEGFKRLCDSRLIQFVVPNGNKQHETQVEFSDIPDSRSLHVLLVAPIYLIQEDRPKEQRKGMEGRLVCKSCNQAYVVDQESHYMAPPWAYADGCDEYCLACWLLGDPVDD